VYHSYYNINVLLHRIITK